MSVVDLEPLPGLIVKIESLQADCQHWRQIANLITFFRVCFHSLTYFTLAYQLIVPIKVFKLEKCLKRFFNSIEALDKQSNVQKPLLVISFFLTDITDHHGVQLSKEELIDNRIILRSTQRLLQSIEQNPCQL
jgi:hypothetical protein